MVAVHRSWANMYARNHDTTNAAVQFLAAMNMLEEARAKAAL
jgi:hypothetical protein